MRKHAAQVQNVRIQEGLTYSEALKKSRKEFGIRRKKQRKNKRRKWQRKKQKRNLGLRTMLHLLLYMAEVVNCSAQTESRTEESEL